MTAAKQVVITGASSGIGAALTRTLAAEGHVIYACARREERLRQVTQHDTLALGRACDVSKEHEVKAFIGWLRGRTSSVDALIHCAGRFGAIGPLPATDTDEWRRTVEANLFGAYLMVKHVVPLLERGRRPRIVTFSGGGAFSPFVNYSAYAVSKAAIVRLTEILALELAPLGITVNAVAPGFVATEIHQATLRVGPTVAGREFFEQTKRALEEGGVPMEVPVACVKFLLSDEAAGLTGKTISASFDPWGAPVFLDLIPQINASDVYTLRRINPINLPESDLRQALSQAHHEREAARSR